MFKRLLIVAVLALTLVGTSGVASVYALSPQQDKAEVQKEDRSTKDELKKDQAPVSGAEKKDESNDKTAPIEAGVPAGAVKEEKQANKEEKRNEKVTICHRTNAANNPYREITVSKNAVDGEGKNDHTSHQGPIVTSYAQAQALKKAGNKWGDIIPNGNEYLGKDILLNHCKIVSSSPAPIAVIDFEIECEAATRTAVISFTNTGTKKGIALLNGQPVIVKINKQTIEQVAIDVLGTQITIDVDSDGVAEFSELYTCEGGQGGVSNPTPTPTPVVTTPAPVAGAGESVASAADVAESAVTSLPYTAGNAMQMVALIAGLAAVLTAGISLIAKKTYLKQL